jgi:diaminopimelate decarboxylase
MPQPIHERTLRAPAFVYRRASANHTPSLFCEQVDLGHLAARYGTPLYVYSGETIRTRLQAFDTAFRSIPHTVCYSVKANSTLAILRLMAAQCAGFDVVSGGELERVLRVIDAPDARSRSKRTLPIVFSGVGKTVPEMELALASNILLFNVESASELHALAALAGRLKKKASIALRVNPDVSAKTHPYISTGLHEHKFGVPISEARHLYAEAAKHSSLRVAGVSVHIGSQIIDLSSFTDALRRVAELVRNLRRAGHTISYVDAGGGLGIPYHDDETAAFSHPNHPERSRSAGEAARSAESKDPYSSTRTGATRAHADGQEVSSIAAGIPFSTQIAAYAQAVIAPLRKLDVHLLLEPGRSIVGPAGVLLTRVIYRKKNDGKRFLIVDAAMNDLIRPSLYGAHHEIVPVHTQNVSDRFWVAQRFSAAKNTLRRDAALAAEAAGQSDNNLSIETELTDVVGPICETGDFLARDRELPITQEGDLLAVLDTGAYGSVLASNYNTRGRPAEVLVDGTRARVIRKRETISDLLRRET